MSERVLWVMLREPTPKQGIPFRFVRLLPRIFGVEIIAVQPVTEGERRAAANPRPTTPRGRSPKELEDLLDGIRDALSDLHTGPPGDPRDDCPGCQAQAMVDELANRILPQDALSATKEQVASDA